MKKGSIISKISIQNQKSTIELFCKTALVLIITKLSLEYWMLPEIPVLYWGIVCILMYSWNKLDLKEQPEKKVLLPTCILLCSSVFLTYVIQNEFTLNDSIILLFLKLLSLFLFSFLLLNFFYLVMVRFSSGNFVNKIDLTRTGVDGKDKKIFIGSILIIFLSWIPYFLVYYLGLIMGDSLNSIYQALGITSWNNHFPFVYSYVIKLCLIPGILTGNLKIGYVLYTIIQMLIISAVLSYVVCWLKNKGFSKHITILICMYYAFSSCFPQHAITMWKDGIFSALLLYIGLQLFDLVISDGEVLKSRNFFLKSTWSAVVICFFRNNGVYIILFICMCLALYNARHHKCWFKEKIRFLLSHCLVVFAVFVITGPVYDMAHIEKEEVEKYGILLQQMARTVVEDGKISESERDFLNELLPIEKYKELYNPRIIDPIKWDADFNQKLLEENQKKFIKTWMDLFLKNPKIYTKAYLVMTYQYWSPNKWEDNKFASNMISGNLESALSDPWWAKAEVQYYNLLENRWLDTRQLFSITTPMVAVGLLVWVMALILVYSIAKQKTVYMLISTPCWGGLVTLLIATPSAYWPRYMLVIYYMLPVLLCMIPMIGKTENKGSS